MMATRTNQKYRTRSAIVDATRELITGGADITMAAVAKAALVSEATAYRYFPDLVTLLSEAMVDVAPNPEVAMAPVAGNDDPVERVAFATELLLRHTLARQGAVRAMMSASITRPESAATRRPVQRFGLIDQALIGLDPATTQQLRRDLAVVMSAEALFILTDLCGLSPEDAVASAVRTARTVTETAVR